jgi:DNA polymerase III sliding clamp (beta) subunit (PCNA family)
MYGMLLIWFFCIVFFSLGNITLALTRKPVKQALKADCVECDTLPEHDFGKPELDDRPEPLNDPCYPDFKEEIETNPEPMIIPRTGKVAMLASNLAKALAIVKDSVGCRTLPILDKVLIEFKNDTATFTTTNLETAIVTTCGCKIESEFTCLLPFKIMKELSEALYDDIVTFEQSTTSSSGRSNMPTILIKQGRQTITLFDADPQDYPPMPKVEGQSVVIGDIGDAIKKVKDKMIPMDSKHWNCGKYTGLFFNLSKPEIVATDGSKMKIATLNCEKKDIQFRIDKDCALTLAKFKNMDCMVTSNDKATRFDFGLYMQGEYPSIKTTIITQNLQGKYPDYESLKETHKEAVTVC